MARLPSWPMNCGFSSTSGTVVQLVTLFRMNNSYLEKYCYIIVLILIIRITLKSSKLIMTKTIIKLKIKIN